MAADFRNVCDYQVKNVARYTNYKYDLFLSNSRWV